LKENAKIFRIILVNKKNFLKIQNLTDEELVEKSLIDSDFFAEIVYRYEKKLFFYLKRLGVCEKDAEELLQEIFLKVYKSLNGFDLKLKFSSWIYRIAHNFAVSSFRKNKETVALDEGIFLEISDKEDLFDEVEKTFEKELVVRVLTKMSLKYREVLLLRFFEDKDYEEISDVLKKPIGTVSVLIKRAKEKFKYLYKEEKTNFNI